jgi:hypothetical protein
MIVRIFKNIRNWYSYYRINRSWDRYWYCIRSTYIRCVQKSFFETSAFYIFYIGVCFVGSYWFICNNDGFFAVICGLNGAIVYANLLLLGVISVCLAIIVYLFANNISYVYISIKRSMYYIYILVKDIFTQIPPSMVQRLFAFVSIAFLFTLFVLLICVFSVYVSPELLPSEKYRIVIHYILSILSLVMSMVLSGYIYYKN